MNKIRLLPLALIIIMALTAIAFADGSDRTGSHSYQERKACADAPLFIGIIQSVDGDSVLTSGIFGIDGDVIVHLPQDRDKSLEFPEGYLLSISYDGIIAESTPQQIWAVSIEALEEDQIIRLDPMEN